MPDESLASTSLSRDRFHSLLPFWIAKTNSNPQPGRLTMEPRNRPRAMAALGHRRQLTRLLSLCALITLAAASGCACHSSFQSAMAPYEDMKHHAVLNLRARIQARKIWHHCYATRYGHRDGGHDVRRGFIDGFVSVASGRGGCPPLFPPSSYCGVLSSHSGSACWFEGFPLGAVEAEKCGWDRPRHHMNPALHGALMQPRCLPGCIPCEPAIGHCECGIAGCGGQCGAWIDSPLLQTEGEWGLIHDDEVPAITHSSVSLEPQKPLPPSAPQPPTGLGQQVRTSQIAPAQFFRRANANPPVRPADEPVVTTTDHEDSGAIILLAEPATWDDAAATFNSTGTRSSAAGG